MADHRETWFEHTSTSDYVRTNRAAWDRIACAVTQTDNRPLAHANDFVLVTLNVRDFARFRGPTVTNWSKPAEFR